MGSDQERTSAREAVKNTREPANDRDFDAESLHLCGLPTLNRKEKNNGNF